MIKGSSIDILKKRFLDEKLPHGILLQGNDLSYLEGQLIGLSQLILSTQNPIIHPDFFVVRPMNKMRQIGVDAIREFVKNLQQTPFQADYKIGVIFEADRLNQAAANALLKTLEEPPAKTILILLTCYPYKVLPTLRSRCQQHRFYSVLSENESLGLVEWLTFYQEWLILASTKPRSTQDVAKRVMGVYQLVHGFEALLGELSEKKWGDVLKTLPPYFTDAEKEAYEGVVKKGVRQQLFYQLASGMRYNVLTRSITTSSIEALVKGIRILEDYVNLLEVNLNETIALEVFLLKLVRLWIQE